MLEQEALNLVLSQNSIVPLQQDMGMSSWIGHERLRKESG